ncbi:regulatory protein MarR [Gordonia bronchialis DSM 43247]|uniref:Regulatory protein MarR n=1 Tax=Gordonia bronchialis (strain ATCC 25592 / DSM 43247 / BCRC 13721 / JCM 3198 / KCTC 3076 / NBRC 16047 / NCTC 10667) TaxID=526226 RepID=D0L7F8_GORB4|nr:MarR family winged helix-turn-helix transcriptional regulator [Gordonia bronchialis]ACY23747.1 regulatory protein MarR [Gordonia bronchialis DSM 43247]MCC3321915.1 MarR family winged helix-turn-helix transcriptional regulator [Gordonia bronchialis]QGS22930.1 MarR family transcriptional regulator [Gordonia bronchialis]UAK36771.1 MarR family winged helix-turn-helix transcriptional regulator [Gordonia bronchialis]STQ66763.1 DNA-binding transcriptional repressor MarR [Gordonia bronchialis]
MGSDPITELETELADFWRRGRIRTRDRTHAIDPRLDPSCYPLLTVLYRNDSLGMSELVTRLALDKSTVTRQIDALVRVDLVERHPDPADARARRVSLTADGRRRVDAVVAAAVADWRTRLSQWDPEDIRTLTTLLRRLSDASD